MISHTVIHGFHPSQLRLLSNTEHSIMLTKPAQFTSLVGSVSWKGCELQTLYVLTMLRLGSGYGVLWQEDVELPLESRLRERGEVGERAGPWWPELQLLCTVEYRKQEVRLSLSAWKPEKKKKNFLPLECRKGQTPLTKHISASYNPNVMFRLNLELNLKQLT